MLLCSHATGSDISMSAAIQSAEDAAKWDWSAEFSTTSHGEWGRMRKSKIVIDHNCSQNRLFDGCGEPTCFPDSNPYDWDSYSSSSLDDGGEWGLPDSSSSEYEQESMGAQSADGMDFDYDLGCAPPE